MQHLDLEDEEPTALIALLTRTIDGDRYQLSPRVRTLKAILTKLRPEPVREPLPPPRCYSPPRRWSREADAEGAKRGPLKVIEPCGTDYELAFGWLSWDHFGCRLPWIFCVAERRLSKSGSCHRHAGSGDDFILSTA